VNYLTKLTDTQRLQSLNQENERYASLYEMINANTDLSNSTIRQVALETFPADFRAHAVKTAKVAELRSVVLQLCERSISENGRAILTLAIRIAEASQQETERQQRNETAAYIHTHLDNYLKNNPNAFNPRELECLQYLIDDGTVDTVEKLQEYTG
jgi:hypothetical protein